MPDDHQNERPMGGQWADQQKKGMKKQRRQATPTTKQESGQNVDEDNYQHGQQGDARAPGKPGQVAYSQGEEAGGDLKSEKKGP